MTAQVDEIAGAEIRTGEESGSGLGGGNCPELPDSSTSAHPTAGTDSWCTPRALAEALGPFDLDPCSNARSHIRGSYRCAIDGSDTRNTIGIDGLKLEWRPEWSVFCNPPYSNVLPWAAKLVAHEGPWCALLKLDPTTKWWATLVASGATFTFFRRRIKFETDVPGKNATANFPSVLVYSAWRPPRALVPWLWLPTYAATEVRT